MKCISEGLHVSAAAVQATQTFWHAREAQCLGTATSSWIRATLFSCAMLAAQSPVTSRMLCSNLLVDP